MGGKCLEKQVLIYNNCMGLVDIMSALLYDAGIGVVTAITREQLFVGMAEAQIKLLLLDIDFGGDDAERNLKLLEKLRKNSRIPIIVVSAQIEEAIKIKTFKAGADDYVLSDCNPMELLARVKCHLSRYMQLAGEQQKLTGSIYRVHELEIDDSRRKVTVSGREVKLTPIEYKILRLLAMERGRVLSISQIYEKIWNMQAIGADNTIAVHIRHIREKIESDPAQPRYLKVVWGSGYKVG